MSDSLFFVLVSMPTQARNSSFLLSGRFFRVAAALGLALLAQTAHADGGMWPFHNVPVEQIITAHLHLLFSGMVVEDCWSFRVTRNVDLTLEEEDADAPGSDAG